MGFFEKFDNFLFDSKWGFENTSRWIEKEFGWDCFEQSMFAYITMPIFLGIASIARDASLGVLAYLAAPSMAIIYIFIVFPAIEMVRSEQSRYYGGATGMWNMARWVHSHGRWLALVSFAPWQMVVLLDLPSAYYLAMILVELYWLTYIAASYLRACTPLPPGSEKGKFWARLRGHSALPDST